MDKVESKGQQDGEKFQKKTTGFVVTFLIGLIIVSFAFSGYESMYGKTSSDTIARVGSYSIKAREFSQEYQRQMQFFSQFMNGGNPLTNQQVQQFRIQESALQNLVQKKLALSLGDKLGTEPSNEEIKNEIKELPYFKTNGQFDVEKYKQLLSANRLTPSEFESEIKGDLKLKKVQAFFESSPVSKAYLSDLQKFRSQRVSTNILKIERKDIMNKLPISEAEIQTYLASPDNMKRVEAIFKERKPGLDQAQQVKARHILLIVDQDNEEKVKAQINELAKKVTPKNFAELAKKNSQDPGSKDKGGDLGYFEKGKMVPEFDEAAFALKVGQISQPVKTSYGYHLILVEDRKEAKEAKLDDYKVSIAKESIQLLKAPEVKKITDELKNEIMAALEKDDMAKAEKLAQNYGLTFKKNIAINRLEGNADVSLRVDQISNIFSATAKAVLLDDPESPILVRVNGTAAAEDKKGEKSEEAQMRAEMLASSRSLQKDVLKNLQDSTKVKVFAKFSEE